MAVVFVDNGTELVIDWIESIVGTAVTASGWYMGWGTGGTVTATNTDIDLGAEATELRVSTTGESQSAADTFQWIGRLTKTAIPASIDEFGLYTDSTGTTTDMIVRADHGTVVMATEDIIEYTCTLQMT